MEELVNKILVVVLVLSILNVLKHIFFAVPYLKTNTRYKINNKEMFLLGLSISYIITCILNGISI
jgi:hypothetical protein